LQKYQFFNKNNQFIQYHKTKTANIIDIKIDFDYKYADL